MVSCTHVSRCFRPSGDWNCATELWFEWSWSVASPGFVVRRGKDGSYICHEALTMDFGAGCSSCSMTNSFVTNAVLIERAVSCWHLHQLISQTTQYLDSWLSYLVHQSELRMKLLEVEGACAQCPIAGDATDRDKGSERLLRSRSVITARCCTDQFSACLECIALGVLAFDLISHRPWESTSMGWSQVAVARAVY